MTKYDKVDLRSTAETAAIQRTLPNILGVLAEADGPMLAKNVGERLGELGSDPRDMHIAVWIGIYTGQVVLEPGTLQLSLPPTSETVS
ncbi:MAG: hypothetical protein V4702_06395 [Patescibacteria group bacterium]